MTTMTETAPVTGLTGAQRAAAERVDALDLEPVAVKLMHPEPGETVMSLAEADELTAAYRRFLKLIAWYPEHGISTATAGPGSQALERLRRTWGDEHEITRTGDGSCRSASRDGKRTYTADSPGGLEALLEADWVRGGAP